MSSSWLSKVITSRQFVFALVFLVIAFVLNFASSTVIYIYFPDRPFIPDLLFNSLPYVGWTQYLTDIANVFSLAILVYYYFHRERIGQLPFVLMVFAFGEFLRGLIIPLNPFGSSLGPGADVHYGLTKIHQYGEFPSGHMMIVVICYLLVANNGSSRALKVLLAVSVAVEAASLLLSRGHYSTDIIGGFLVAYFAYHFFKQYKNRFVIQPN